MAKIVTFINEKGGVGKTSSCFNSAWEIASRGRKILMIDMDGQRANLSFFAGVEKTEDMMTMNHVFRRGVSIKETIFEIKENLDIVPANEEMSNIGMEAKVLKFRKALSEVKDEYDYIFIDVNPTPGWSHYLSMSVTDYAVIVMLPDIASLEGNRGIVDTVQEIQGTNNHDLRVAGILFNKCNGKTVLSRQVIQVAEDMAAEIDTAVFDTKIREGVVLSENLSTHEGVTTYSPRSKSANDFKNFADELERRIARG